MIISTIEQSAIDFYTENVNYVSGFGLINLEREDRRLYNKGKNLITKIKQFKKDSEKNVKWTVEEYDTLAAAYVKHCGDRKAILREFRLYSERHSDNAIDIASQACLQLDNTIKSVSGLKDIANGLKLALKSINNKRFSN